MRTRNDFIYGAFAGLMAAAAFIQFVLVPQLTAAAGRCQ